MESVVETATFWAAVRHMLEITLAPWSEPIALEDHGLNADAIEVLRVIGGSEVEVIDDDKTMRFVSSTAHDTFVERSNRVDRMLQRVRHETARAVILAALLDESSWRNATCHGMHLQEIVLSAAVFSLQDDGYVEAAYGDFVLTSLGTDLANRLRAY